MSHFGPQSRSSLAPRAAWVIEGGHHRGGGRCVRPRRGCDGGHAVVAGTCRQHPALEVPCDHAFEHRCVRSCWQASRQDGRRREGDRFGLLELIGCMERRLVPPLQTLQWECGSSHSPSLSPFGVPKARRRYTNLIVWLPPHVRPVAERYLAAASIAPRCRRLRCLRLRCLRRLRLRRHRRTLLPPLADAPPAPTSCQPPQRSPPVDAPPLLTRPHRPARCHRVAACAFRALCLVVDLASSSS